jgi:DNA polymerase-3 subunit beta
VLGNVLFVPMRKRAKLSLTAFDLSLGIRTSFRAEVVEGGKITLPAKLLNDIVSRLGEGKSLPLWKKTRMMRSIVSLS